MKTHYLFLIGFFGLAVFYPPCSNAQDNPLLTLKALEGDWKGNGWVKMPERETVQFNQIEKIEFKLNDQIMVVNGKGTDLITNELKFEAFGVVFKDNDGKLKMNAHTSDGRNTIADFSIESNKFTWVFEVPNGTIKYISEVIDNTWIEKGSFSPDGQQWYPFMEMTLKKD